MRGSLELGAFRAAVLALGVACVQACAPLGSKAEDASARFAPPSDVFSIHGRLAARHGTEGVSANFRWRHDGDRDSLELVSPLGQTIARMSGSPGKVELERSNGTHEVAQNWEALTQRGLGWTLPVSGLASWIQGSPHPGSASRAETQSEPMVLRQDGWMIVYSAAIETPVGPRPSRLTLSYPEVEVRLAVDEWQ